MGTKEAKAASGDGHTVFVKYSLGVGTNRDEWVYDFSSGGLAAKVKQLIQNYNYEVFRFSQEKPKPTDIDAFVNNDPRVLKWTDRLKQAVAEGRTLRFEPSSIRGALYRPFTRTYLYLHDLLNQRRYQQHWFFPSKDVERENRAIIAGGYGRKDFAGLISYKIPDLNFFADPAQCFPFFTYEEDAGHRRENITDWVLEEFRLHCGDPKISKWDIFYYVYGVLHHPGYREKFADCLKRELPRIPLAADFKAFAAAGKELARLHLDYEKLEPYPLKFISTDGIPLSYRVEDKMRLNKEKTALKVNLSLTLSGIPPLAFQYRLGNRSALEWVIDQYQVREDPRSGIRSDPNRTDDPEYIVRLVGQVIHVSLETVRVVRSLPENYGT